MKHKSGGRYPGKLSRRGRTAIGFHEPSREIDKLRSEEEAHRTGLPSSRCRWPMVSSSSLLARGENWTQKTSRTSGPKAFLHLQKCGQLTGYLLGNGHKPGYRRSSES